ncbi:endolytic transglycosylase MltG [uncultured Eubacterium sp.]|uniref:endolytic transglycosylase MltG n=1 Tax=uncultured Eubacterium sp. TaxID=165185 RepID=UPI002670EC61|nr:endolytic transglycosylase MltG [uncultured Eubacterium sp.]
MNNRKTSQGFAKVSIKMLKYVVMVVVIVICATAAFNFGSKIFNSEGMEPEPGTDMTFTIEDGTTIKSFGKTLEEYGVIGDADVFVVQSYVYSVKKIKPGTYSFNTSWNGEEIFKTLSAGPEEDKQDKK